MKLKILKENRIIDKKGGNYYICICCGKKTMRNKNIYCLNKICKDLSKIEELFKNSSINDFFVTLKMVCINCGFIREHACNYLFED